MGGCDPGVLGPGTHVGMESSSKQPEMTRTEHTQCPGGPQGPEKEDEGHWAGNRNSAKPAAGLANAGTE